ncbi:ABC transporter membrane protein (plasmid) [Deinococcus aetherius]|uniref:ABC transporter membrane protein n=1 Tax=Deinococcus aetherius TaxID=200252 RepID=A0ABM8AJX7_9DEIO|nr:ABC transporter permease subunit [Deinococcus aetherius]BDP44129.1 ABC transporter membrane protein [Deinococcus aetherius]
MRAARRTLTAALILGAALPLALLLVWSFSLRWYYPALLPQEFSTRAWEALLAPSGQVSPALRGSTWVAGVTALLATLIALPAARQLARERPLTRAVLGGVILAPLVLPAFAGVMGVQVAFIRLGLADTPAGVVAAHLIPATPYAAVLLTGTFEVYDARFEEVARTLGARRAQVFTRVTLPLLLPGVLVAALLAFLVSWSEYLLTLIVGGGQVSTLPLLLFASAQGGDYALTAALSLVYVLPALLIFTLVAGRLRGWRA